MKLEQSYEEYKKELEELVKNSSYHKHQWDKILDDIDVEYIEEYLRKKKLSRIKGNIKRKGDR